jgi:phage-related protein
MLAGNPTARGNAYAITHHGRIKFYTMNEKEIRWIGSSYDDIFEFPATARREAGFQLGRLQAGLDPEDWKPFDEVGPGAREIRIRDSNGIFRVMYVAKFEEAVYVLHCFQKKTQTTSRQDKEIAATRYRAIARERKA